MSKIRLLTPALLVGLLLTSCASEAVKAQARKEKEEKEKYVNYYPTGSNIPVKVPKDQVKATDQETDGAQMAMRNVQRNNATVPKDN